MISKDEIFGYTPDKKYKKPVAYFSMEFAIDQALKIYSGGLGFLAGSHMRSAYELKQNVVGIGMLWKLGYYDQSRDLCMTLQAAVNFKEYFRCYVVGQEDVRIMAYDPRRPHEHRYVLEPQEYPEGLLARVEKDALTLCRALGYDLNTVEFAVEDGVPYAIDFMNPAPDADRHSVGEENFQWILEKVANLAVKKAQNPVAKPEFRWAGFLGAETTSKAKAAPKKAAAKKAPAKRAAKKAVKQE